MISVNELRAQTTYEEDGQIFQVISFEHIKMGRGSANIRLKVKNLRSGVINDKSYINSAKVKDIQIRKKDLQFLYKDSDNCYFMDTDDYSQITISIKSIPDNKYLKESEMYNISFLEGIALNVSIPPKLVFKVIDTAPGIKGNSATNVFKDAILENDIKVKVPLFINIGESIRIDTRTATYTEKA